MAYHSELIEYFPEDYLGELLTGIRHHPLLASNNLTRDFVGARGFSVVFRRDGSDPVKQRFPWLGAYIDALLDDDCNAFYLNPLVLGPGARVDPHVDRSLRAYCRTIETPVSVSVLYVALPEPMQGGQLVLRAGKRQVARIVPAVNKVVRFQGDLIHMVTPLGPAAQGERVSVVCEQYALQDPVLSQIPSVALESGGKRY